MEASALVIWLHGLQSCACHVQQLLIATRIRHHFPWVKWLLPESEIGDLTVLPRKKLKRWFDLHKQPVVDGEEHHGMKESVQRIHSLLYSAIDQGFPPDRIILCGFSQGGALALQAGLSFPHTLAGICSVAGWVSAGIQTNTSQLQMPILMCHGFDDSMVPISIARSSCKALAALGYQKVNLITFKGLRHQLTTLQFEDIMEFYRQLLPQRLEEPCPLIPIAGPAGCIVWMHDASIIGDVDEHILARRLHQCLPEVKLILQRLPQHQEGTSFGRMLLDEITEQLQKASESCPLSSIMLGGFGAGGTAALLGLLFPQLAGLVSCSGFLADCFPEQQVEPGTDPLILLTHGEEDKQVPIAAARQQREALHSHGYRGVSFSAFQDLGHDFNLTVWDNVIEFAEITLDRGLATS